ncbi:retron St85 family RNA-directed DNA polymerase [Proteus sp. CD3]|uniref:retron St85 family RNA-directed DNA polymerase n=1 Tax=Proteus sp. CD3 TaxID=1921565 RepID=UPI00124A42E8|nr:retron St85 family RNA-directed DNA polymerase [Proteus sp. CD3]QEZ91932.1 RNA-dependent DNA polymerase [Proteus sp. CD3]
MLKIFLKLQNELATSKEDGTFPTRATIERFARTAMNCYKVYSIPKRTSGVRVIAHPSKELKNYQRALVSILESQFEPHPASYAYQKGKNIKLNAQKHAKKKFLLKMDFNDFFNSITPQIFLAELRYRKILLSKAEENLLINLFFWNKTKSEDKKLVLSVGAPSSPMLSNFIMYRFDEIVSEYARENSIVYTRYADDLTFSTNIKDILFSTPEYIKGILRNLYQHYITINDSKTVFTSMAHNRHVTGVTITNNFELSIGRERKRLISVMTHKFKIGVLNEEDLCYLQGLLSFAINIEPNFIKRLSRKYGKEIVNVIRMGGL